MPCAPGRSLGSEVYVYHHNQNMIAIVAVRANVILGRPFCSTYRTICFHFLGKYDILSQKVPLYCVSIIL
jgi:hypothetical protein